ncbi:MAG: glycosyltransferase family 4 protein [Candidatus Eisenbacteria bacterium]|uniref:Glycosyltransferase family 4 protein n=1 Tax=Eiseniibacteriota bacterium TaxID=2212470 RepID=A0A849SN94_UNCEI|nr:glycosyltransferase family 4 protein [Candidatus Eisenbacteria bacterium]
MKVAIDARKLFDGGIGAYVRGLLGALATRREGHEFVALMPPELLGRVSWPNDTVIETPVTAGKYGFAEHFVVPRAATRAGARLLHAPHYTLPLLWTGPAVVTIHDLIHLRFPSFHPTGAATYARLMAGFAAKRAQLVIADSEYGRQEIVSLLGIEASKVRVIPLAPAAGLAPAGDEAVLAFRTERRLPPDYVLYVGARKRHKNLEVLMRAIAILARTERPPLVLSGSPWSAQDDLARLARVLGIEDTIAFAGPLQNDGELACLYSGARVYAQPSLAEGFGLPPLEAMACNVPVIASNVTAMPEVLGHAARLVPPDQPEAWAAALRDVLSNEWERTRMTLAGRTRAESFTWAKTAEQTMKAYEEAVG